MPAKLAVLIAYPYFILYCLFSLCQSIYFLMLPIHFDAGNIWKALLYSKDLLLHIKSLPRVCCLHDYPFSIHSCSASLQLQEAFERCEAISLCFCEENLLKKDSLEKANILLGMSLSATGKDQSVFPDFSIAWVI